MNSEGSDGVKHKISMEEKWDESGSGWRRGCDVCFGLGRGIVHHLLDIYAHDSCSQNVNMVVRIIESGIDSVVSRVLFPGDQRLLIRNACFHVHIVSW